jgi:hypothetical protein
MWLDYMEECLAYNMMAQPYSNWFPQNKWYLKKVYRTRYGKLQEQWQSDHDRRNTNISRTDSHE